MDVTREIEQYRGRWKICGVYGIKCKVNGKWYVGGSRSIKARWKIHRYDLRSQIHSSKKLQDDYNLFGLDAFELIVVEELPEGVRKQDLRTREQYWIEQKDSICNGYNTDPAIGGFSKEHIQKVMASRIGFKHTIETRQKMSLIHTGIRPSVASRQKRSDSLKAYFARKKASVTV